MNSKLIYTLVMLFMLCSFKCKKSDSDINQGYIHNMSQHTITISMSNNYNLDPLYPDTILPIQRTTTGGQLFPNEKKEILHKSVSWKSIYDIKADIDTISFFVYDVDTLEKYPWDTIREQYMILQRYDLSLHDLQKLNFTILFPPSEAMRNMKMYPSYGVTK